MFGFRKLLLPLRGLLLCTSTDVLQEGRAGTDVAVRVAERVRELDTRTAQASNQNDLRMIHAARSSLVDLFDSLMNGFFNRCFDSIIGLLRLT